MRADSSAADADDLVPESGVRPPHLIVTVFGRHVRAHGGEIRIAALIEMMSALGVDAGVVRSSVSRLKQRGVLVSEGGGAYRLSASLDGVFAAGDRRIFESRRAEAKDPWLLASFSVPESERPVRHQLRRLLQRLGFGQVSGGLWIAPGLIVDETETALRGAGLDGYVDLFLGSRVSSEPAEDSVREWWDLSAMEPLYRAFVDTFGGVIGETDERAAFAAHVRAITQWRRLVYLDPGLPLGLLPDGWVGVEAARVFAELHAALEPAAERFVTAVMP
ncbi:phenylacetic acid degradation operon negative regulatory protein [Microbacterium phyllosphaerae]|uniref:Phenylacetic acid degradation operon negative regulatory protein n=1 Tax=Microbacterium phyllosphaerae TaxID=124798 RepID=A0ABS4WTY3_9MICO|nr:PaaX family transcriptional regulator C-terminal domain-containing protein [Microbacterium phyllosphaerae]MBP2379671.1 phenylacetic acid degradation operon negative regulatory protein [Microbacterium phyllosphaerae]